MTGFKPFKINHMKTHILMVSLFSLVLGGCSNTRQAAVLAPTDDLYYSKSDEETMAAETPVSETPVTNQESEGNQGYTQASENSQNEGQNYQDQPVPDETNTRQEGGNTYVTNNYYDDDDYYDYTYSSRIRRFYGGNYGWSYYDDYYTNRYWYDYYPNSWGVSIYTGYNWWGPSYYYSCSPLYSGFYGYSYHPWYGNGFGYNNGYWNGYNHGYIHGLNDGYANGYHPYYYNSYDNNSTYYGPRGSSGSGNRMASSNGEKTYRNQSTLADKYSMATVEGRPSSTNHNSGGKGRALTGNTTVSGKDNAKPAGTRSNSGFSKPGNSGVSNHTNTSPRGNSGKDHLGNVGNPVRTENTSPISGVKGKGENSNTGIRQGEKPGGGMRSEVSPSGNSNKGRTGINPGSEKKPGNEIINHSNGNAPKSGLSDRPGSQDRGVQNEIRPGSNRKESAGKNDRNYQKSTDMNPYKANPGQVESQGQKQREQNAGHGQRNFQRPEPSGRQPQSGARPSSPPNKPSQGNAPSSRPSPGGNRRPGH